MTKQISLSTLCFFQRGREGRDPNDWIRLLKKQVRLNIMTFALHFYLLSDIEVEFIIKPRNRNNDPKKQEDGTEQIVPIPQVLR